MDLREKRESTRVSVAIATRMRRFAAAEAAGEFKVTIRDLSRRGMFLSTDEPLGEGEIIEVDIRLPQRGIAFRGTGVVRWRRADAPAGVGVELLIHRAAPAHKAALEGFINERLAWN